MSSMATESTFELKPDPARDHPDRAWHVAIPRDECSFAIIDASSLAAKAPSRRLIRSMIASRSPALDEALQRWLPLPIADIHAAYGVVEPPDTAPGEPPRIVACAISRTTLERLKAQGALTAAPAALPPALADAGFSIDPASLNLMVGEFQPPAIRSATRLQHWLIAATLILGTALLTLGFSRRAEHDELRARALAVAAAAVESRAAVVSGHSRVDPNRVRAVLAAEAARLNSALGGPPGGEQHLDAAALTADILARWPRDRSDLFARLQNIQIVGAGISLTVVLPADADPEPILAPLRTIPNWQLQPTQRTSSAPSPSGKPEARLNLRLIPAASNPTIPNPDPLNRSKRHSMP